MNSIAVNLIIEAIGSFEMLLYIRLTDAYMGEGNFVTVC